MMGKKPSSDIDRRFPTWLRNALHEPTPDRESTKRQEPRQPATGLANVTSRNNPDGERIPVRLYNVGVNGIGFTARSKFDLGDELTLTPEGTPKIVEQESSVHLRVIHCTQTVQGFKVGCVLI